MTNIIVLIFMFILSSMSENETFKKSKSFDLSRNETNITRLLDVFDVMDTVIDMGYSTILDKNNGSLRIEQIKEPKTCLTKDCISASNNLFNTMDLNSDPCEDFNQFACGNFIKERSIPDDKGKLDTSFSPTGDLRKINKMIYGANLSSCNVQFHELNFSNKVFYWQCLNEEEFYLNRKIPIHRLKPIKCPDVFTKPV